MAKHKFASISLTVRDRAISLKFSTHRVSKECTLCNFQKIFPSQKMAAILNFRIFAKNGKTQIYHLLYFCTALSLVIMLSSHYYLHKSKTLSQLTQCPFTGTLLLFLNLNLLLYGLFCVFFYVVTLRRVRRHPREQLLQKYKAQRHAVFFK